MDDLPSHNAIGSIGLAETSASPEAPPALPQVSALPEKLWHMSLVRGAQMPQILLVAVLLIATAKPA
jgi:hypothetical protein